MVCHDSLLTWPDYDVTHLHLQRIREALGVDCSLCYAHPESVAIVLHISLHRLQLQYEW